MEQSEILQYLAELTGIEGHAFHRAILLEVVVWFVMIAAVIIDFSTGIRKARVLKIPRDSHGFRRSFEKFGDYGKVTGMLMLFDLLAILFGIYSLPYASGLAGVGVVYTEYKSVRENLTAIRSAAVKMTTLVELLANAHDPKEITGLLLKYNEVKDSADKGKARRDQLNTLLNLTQNENIDNGHGKETPGKRSPVWPDGSQLYEYEFNRDIARRVYAVLTARGVDCELIVSEICDISLAERVRRVNKIARVVGPSNCLLVSIHANAGGGTGWEAWTSIGQTEAENYATIFYEEDARAFPEKRMRKDMTDGDPDKEENFYILKHTSCPTVLTENFFMDTKDDCKLIFSGSGRQRVADMHVAAIVRCIEYHNNK